MNAKPFTISFTLLIHFKGKYHTNLLLRRDVTLRSTTFIRDACDATHAPRTQDIQNATTSTQCIYGDTNSFPLHTHTRSAHRRYDFATRAFLTCSLERFVVRIRRLSSLLFRGGRCLQEYKLLPLRTLPVESDLRHRL